MDKNLIKIKRINGNLISFLNESNSGVLKEDLDIFKEFNIKCDKIYDLYRKYNENKNNNEINNSKILIFNSLLNEINIFVEESKKNKKYYKHIQFFNKINEIRKSFGNNFNIGNIDKSLLTKDLQEKIRDFCHKTKKLNINILISSSIFFENDFNKNLFEYLNHDINSNKFFHSIIVLFEAENHNVKTLNYMLFSFSDFDDVMVNPPKMTSGSDFGYIKERIVLCTEYSTYHKSTNTKNSSYNIFIPLISNLFVVNKIDEKFTGNDYVSKETFLSRISNNKKNIENSFLLNYFPLTKKRLELQKKNDINSSIIIDDNYNLNEQQLRYLNNHSETSKRFENLDNVKLEDFTEDPFNLYYEQ